MKEQQPLKLFKNMLGWHSFRDFQRQEAAPAQEGEEAKQDVAVAQMSVPDKRLDADHAISVCAGYDNLLKIGEPHGAGNRSNVSIDRLWQEEVENNFKKVKSDESTVGGLPNMAKNREEKVDKMRAQKDLELEDYRREIERAKRFEKSKLLN